MSGSPFIKRAKSRSNIRQRDSPGDVTGPPLASSVTASQDQGVEEDEQIFSPMAMAKARKKEKEKKKSGLGGSGKARLSFGGDGEDAVSVAWPLLCACSLILLSHPGCRSKGVRPSQIHTFPEYVSAEACC